LDKSDGEKSEDDAKNEIKTKLNDTEASEFCEWLTVTLGASKVREVTYFKYQFICLILKA
jgi:hypothetical protein